MKETAPVVAHVTARPNTVVELRALLLDPPEPPQWEAGGLRAALPRHPTDLSGFTQAVPAQASPWLAAAPGIRRYGRIGSA